jgi:uncharacterized membrane-anchored protein
MNQMTTQNPSVVIGPVRLALLVVGACLLLLGFNYAVYSKTQTLSYGAVVKLKLAPRDPRALLTGDYMTLNYDIANQLRTSSQKRAQDGYVIVQLNEQGVGEFVSQIDTYPSLKAGQLALQFRQREREVKFATNAYYFQEGHAKTFEAAKYGEFRVSSKGELILTHLLDEQLQRLLPTTPTQQ